MGPTHGRNAFAFDTKSTSLSTSLVIPCGFSGAINTTLREPTGILHSW